MYVATLRFSVQPEKMADTITVLTALCSQTSVLAGCRFCKVYSNISMPEGDDEILLIERWDTKENMERHILSPIFHQLIEIMDFSTAPPELLFQQVSKTSGVDMVEELCRNKQKLYGGECFD
ncbi:putative antibiotic biosynthesis monooxygenase [Desulfosarcina variabilis str. Montpellier]|uniref:putative quinol monooxygenase n=1 Tax=Desulfosarcina variabilis TaxID=2300 RepID=UPI003AFAB252